LTAAHKTLPLPSVARITNLENNKSIIVLINDRGPYSSKRIVDVSERAADALNMKNKGSAKVKIELLPQESKELLAQLNLKQPIVKNSNDKNIEVTSKKEFVNKVEKNKINKIYIQVGSFKHPKNANNTAQKIAHLGQVKIDKINTKEQLIYRVRVGPIKKKQAKIVLAKVIKAGNKEAIIINKS
jgi:rare lipoprotein A